MKSIKKYLEKSKRDWIAENKNIWENVRVKYEDGDYAVCGDFDEALWEAHEQEIMELLETVRFSEPE